MQWQRPQWPHLGWPVYIGSFVEYRFHHQLQLSELHRRLQNTSSCLGPSLTGDLLPPWLEPGVLATHLYGPPPAGIFTTDESCHTNQGRQKV